MFFSFFRRKDDEDDDDFYSRPDPKDKSNQPGEGDRISRLGSTSVGRIDRNRRALSGKDSDTNPLSSRLAATRPGAESQKDLSSSTERLKRRYEEYERDRKALGESAGGSSVRPLGNTSGSAHYAASKPDVKSSSSLTLDRAALEKRLNSIGRPTAQINESVGHGFISRNPDVVPSPNRARAPIGGGNVSDMQYHRFATYLQEKSGIVLGENKQYLVNSRLSSLLETFRISSIDDLLTRCMEGRDDELTEAVINAMTTNETLWFRDTYPYLALSNIILPELAMSGKTPVRIWSSACSSGQEPYSIAITVLEMMGRMVHIDPTQVQIIATDLSTAMLQRCRAGYYDAHALSRGLSAERRAKFFRPTHNPALMQIDPRVKRMVEFRQMNLLGSYALMGRFDVIFCRNVLIYFNNDVKASILRKFAMCLNKGGYLILGSTETLVGVADQFEMIRCHPGIIYKKIR